MGQSAWQAGPLRDIPSPMTLTNLSTPEAPNAVTLSTPEDPTPEYQPSRGQTAFNAIKPQLDALTPDQFQRLNADVEAAAIVALGVGQRVIQLPWYPRFQRLPREEFDITGVHQLEEAAWAAWYGAKQAGNVRALMNNAKLPPVLVERASELEGRMQRLCEYHLSDHPEIGRVVARLRSGSGYRDLAGDLLGYAELYRTQNDILRRDTKNYRPTDHGDAVRLAEEILMALGVAAGPEGRRVNEDLARVWTYLVNVYDDVSKTGLWLMRNEPEAAQRREFPSLFAAGRAARRPRRPEADDGGKPSDPPAPAQQAQ
jgi:hypothetical protein